MVLKNVGGKLALLNEVRDCHRIPFNSIHIHKACSTRLNDSGDEVLEKNDRQQ